jgi:hypothetical protein
MNDTAAYWTDHLIGAVPVRHWVCTVPPPIRYLLAHDVTLCRDVLDAFVGAVFRWQKAKAKMELGLASVRQAHPAAVTVVHRASSHLALNVHFHSLVADGVFVQPTVDEPPEFRALPAPTRGEVMSVAWEVCTKTLKLLKQRGLWMEMDSGDDRFAQEQPGLAQIHASSIAGLLSMGSRAGQRLMRFGAMANGAEDDEPFAAQGVTPGYGFSVHATRRISAHDRAAPEGLARYVARPPLAQNRLKLLADGKVQWELKRVWSDGTSHFVFEPLDFLAKLAALVFPPRMHRVRYHGAWARRAKLRRLVMPHPPALSACAHQQGHADNRPCRPRYDWATLLARVFSADVLKCDRCQARMQRIAWIQQPDAIRKILRSVGLAADSPEPAPSRWPEQTDLFAVA